MGAGFEELTGKDEDGEGNGEVEKGAVFGEVGGSEVDGDLFIGEGKTRIYEGTFDALASLGNGFIGHANDIKSGKAFVHVALNLNGAAFEAMRQSGINLCYHMRGYSTVRKKCKFFVNFRIFLAF